MSWSVRISGSVMYMLGVASEQCKIVPPLSTNTLSPLLETLEARLGHNFYPAILCIASTGMYQQFIQKMRHCPIPVAFGPSGTCKTTALESALSLLGAQKRVFSKITKEKVYEIRCNSGGIPIGLLCDINNNKFHHRCGRF